MLLANNPELFRHLYSDEIDPVDEENIEYVKPESPAEFEAMMDELRTAGVLEG